MTYCYFDKLPDTRQFFVRNFDLLKLRNSIKEKKCIVEMKHLKNSLTYLSRTHIKIAL